MASPDPAAATTASIDATAIGAVPVARAPMDIFQRRRQIAAVTAIVFSSSAWITAMWLTGIFHAALPWCITLGSAAAASVIWLCGRRPELETGVLRVKMRHPMTFVEAFAGSYLAASLVLCAWIGYSLVAPPEPPIVKAQVVDIELTGLADFKDNQSILPSSNELETLRKRTTSDTMDSQGQLNPTAQPINTVAVSQQTPAPPMQAEKTVTRPDAVATAAQSARLKAVESPSAVKPNPSDKEVATQQKIAVTSPDNSMLRAPSKTPSPFAADKRAPAVAAYQDDQPLMQEVDPPELVELLNNDGDHSLNVFQPGGRTSGGTGAHSDLALYLKELNRRIKTHWSPPRGENRRAEVLFRIKRTGGLASVRVTRSSGDAQSDEAAIKAIASAAPFNALPGDYPLAYLDVAYTFNYSVDQLTEVTGQHL